MNFWNLSFDELQNPKFHANRFPFGKHNMRKNGKNILDPGQQIEIFNIYVQFW
jgi:hypothetical protein